MFVNEMYAVYRMGNRTIRPISKRDADRFSQGQLVRLFIFLNFTRFLSFREFIR